MSAIKSGPNVLAGLIEPPDIFPMTRITASTEAPIASPANPGAARRSTAPP